MHDDFDERDYVDLPTAAKRMGIAPSEVLDLVRHRVLRAVSVFGEPWIEPAIVSGATP